MNSIYLPNNSYSVKLGRAANFMTFLADAVSLFLLKTLDWKRITFPRSNSLNLAELVVNELIKIIPKNLPIFLFLFELSLLNVKIARAYN